MVAIVTLESYYCSTFKRCCPAGIKLGLTDDCQKLVVTEMRMEHNHATSKVNIYIHLNTMNDCGHEIYP